MVEKFLAKILKFSETVHEKEWGKRVVQKKQFYDHVRGLVDNHREILELKH